MANFKLSIPTTRRLPLYYRYLRRLSDQKVEKVSSAMLAEYLQIDAATIRRDFSYFGQMGRRGYGYDVQKLLELFDDALRQDINANVALVRVGNLGRALLNFKFHRVGNARITAAFDVDPKLVNTVQNQIPVYDIKNLKEQIKEQQITVAILAVPAEKAQELTDQLLEVGIQGILNFTTVPLTVPEKVIVQDVDLSVELQSLIYGINRREIEELE